MQQRLRKFRREPHRIPNRQITPRTLQVIATISRYRLIPTSLLLPLVGGDYRTTHDHLQWLFHTGVISRLPLRLTGSGEVCYYLDNREALQLLVEHGAADPEELDWEQVSRNRENQFEAITDAAGGSPSFGRLLYLNHELMISRFHAMLELACRRSEGELQLARWRQGPQLWNSIDVPMLTYDQQHGTWQETEETEVLPHRPDAFFTLRLPASDRELHFFYEADRKTTTKTERIRKKYRAHFHFIVKHAKHREHYGIDRLRAVLTETLDARWAERLREEARHPAVSGPKPSPLFWFTTSELFTKQREIQQGSRVRKVPAFLADPGLIFNEVWAQPTGDRLHSLLE